MTAILKGRRTGTIAIIAAIAILATSGVGSAGVLSLFNKAPVAHNQSFSAEGAPTEVTLYATDAERNKLSFLVTQEPLHGTLSGQAPSFLYTPAPGFTGTDSFTWRASDGMKTSNTGTASISNTSTAAAPEAEASVEPLSHGVPITYVASTANAAALVADFATSLGLLTPGGTAVGDVMYMWVAFSLPTSLADFFSATPTVPAGWVPVYGGDPTVAYCARGVLFSKIATAADLGATHTIEFPAPMQVAASISTFRGIDTRAPLWMVKSGGQLGTVLTQPLVLPSVHAPADSMEVVATTSFGASLTDPAGMTPIVRLDNDEVLNLPVVSPLAHTEIQGSIQARPVAGDTGNRIANFTGLLQPVALPLCAVGVHFSLRPA